MNTSRTPRRTLIALAASSALIVPAILPGSPLAPQQAAAAPGMAMDIEGRGCSQGTQRIYAYTNRVVTIASDRVSTGYCHWESNAPAGFVATKAWVHYYAKDYASTGARTLYLNGAGDCWGAGRAGDGIADGRAIEHNFRSHGACVVMAQDRNFDYKRTVFTNIGQPQMWVEDAQGPSASTPTVSAATTNGWLRPTDQPQTAPAAPLAGGTMPVKIAVSWSQADNEAWRGSTGITVNGQNIDYGDLGNGTHTREITVTGPVTISAWRTGHNWGTATTGNAGGGVLNVDASLPAFKDVPSARFDNGAISMNWFADDGGSGLDYTEAQIKINGAWQRLALVANGKPMQIAVDTDLPNGTYPVRVVARDRAGNWQVTPAMDLVIARPAAIPSTGAGTGAGNAGGNAGGATGGTGTARPTASGTSAPTAAKRPERRTRYTITAEFADGNTRQTTFRAARRGVTITGRLVNGYGDPVANATVRIQQNTQQRNKRVWTTTTDGDGKFTIRVATRTRGVLGATSDNVIRPVRLYVNR